MIKTYRDYQIKNLYPLLILDDDSKYYYKINNKEITFYWSIIKLSSNSIIIWKNELYYTGFSIKNTKENIKLLKNITENTNVSKFLDYFLKKESNFINEMTNNLDTILKEIMKYSSDSVKEKKAFLYRKQEEVINKYWNKCVEKILETLGIENIQLTSLEIYNFDNIQQDDLFFENWKTNISH